MRKIIFCLMLVVSTIVTAASLEDDFLKLREAFRVGDAAKLALYAPRFQRHALAPYAEYYQIRLYLETTSVDSIQAFLQRHQGSLIGDKLRGDWLRVLGKRQQWTLFAEEYPKLINKDEGLICYALQLRLASKDKEVIEEARSLWFTEKDMPDSCTPVFSQLIANQKLSHEDIWFRIRLALEAGNTGVARQVSRYLPGNHELNAQKLNEASKNPLRYLEKFQGSYSNRADREIVLFALGRLLRSEINQAYVHLLKIRNHFPPTDQSFFMSSLAYRAALKQDDRALDWFIQAVDKHPYPLSEAKHAWMGRVALRKGNWNHVLQIIDNMPDSMQKMDVWRYWKARALLKNGELGEANAILAPLSNEHSYYGQMAKEELGVMMSSPAANYHPSSQEIHAMQQNPGIQRALALYQFNQRIEAAREWVWTIRNFTDEQLIAAAEVAFRHGIYDRAINTAIQTVSQHNFNLRYLAPYRDQMREVLKHQELDEAFVYGLIRQESRFLADVKSTAGAMGLMQLMPATAKWVAGKLGMQQFQNHLVTDINTNLRLGTYYLKHVLSLFDNQPLLAAAAYNAGPGRAKQWRDPEKPLEGAIYAETIPFNETRDYVKVVLNNSVYYANNFGHQNIPPLRQRLGVVAPKPQ
ncbi:MAG TPA: transglycosylase SLT domain-containing protein [Nitrosomonas sp.]|nr:transglycosylase SLT domain-containing protein [Nitrosomonas sp.]HMW68216.1 transglycosylase SLT domain-containing protein [Nitrosomonas sp.]HMY60571.1 transglycosylase SLT domain-containing protein [Nitrosomonas sp.]HMY89548.1 transglycosylase SLT domain-containing protein [Nitrosomonas sp.]HNA69749.1 transglycosylase SLT domain-containing protein [Nitrosomonas sp.]